MPVPTRDDRPGAQAEVPEVAVTRASLGVAEVVLGRDQGDVPARRQRALHLEGPLRGALRGVERERRLARLRAAQPARLRQVAAALALLEREPDDDALDLALGA